jgi:hypothetical protein
MTAGRNAACLVAGMCFLVLGSSCWTVDDLNPEYHDCATRHAWYPDDDGDGAGNPAELWVTCDQPDGWVPVAGDCDDLDPKVQDCPKDTSDTSDSGDTGAPAQVGHSSLYSPILRLFRVIFR